MEWEKNKLEFIYGIDLSANGKYSKCVDNVYMWVFVLLLLLLPLMLLLRNELSIVLYSLSSDTDTVKLGHMMRLKWRCKWGRKGKWMAKRTSKQQVHVKRDNFFEFSHCVSFIQRFNLSFSNVNSEWLSVRTTIFNWMPFYFRLYHATFTVYVFVCVCAPFFVCLSL